ncbi:MAG TPA: triose-phosphate isomerase [Casimicrobiaceae bacterium]|nr:triose-phosphate isomerase [Casimicrobiaceae bacterium]
MEHAPATAQGRSRAPRERAARLVVGNWKENGSLASNARLLASLAAAEVDCALAVCVPFPYLVQAQAALQASDVAWGAQDVSANASGAYTGEVAAAMLAEFGCTYALAGHSERRQWHGERDDVVAAKAAAALAARVTPIVCIGETLAERERGDTHAVVLRQLDAVLTRLGAASADIVLAYEPVWAIGTGRSATPGEAQEVHALLRRRLAAAGAAKVSVLYGGSVKAANAGALFAERDIDGALVGGASLDADEFLTIAQAARSQGNGS